MKKETFLKRVIQEIETIKTKATDEEKSRLDFSTFNHNSGEDCIYGQMTGYCYSERANELYIKNYENVGDLSFEVSEFSKGKKFTSLEKYLFYCGNSTHLKIIEYIKGESNELNIEL